jgi:hypothetical protein
MYEVSDFFTIPLQFTKLKVLKGMLNDRTQQVTKSIHIYILHIFVIFIDMAHGWGYHQVIITI